MSSTVKRIWRSAALAGALLMLGACSKAQEPGPAAPPPAEPWAEPAPHEGAKEARKLALVEQPSKVEYVMPREPVTGTAPAGPPPADFKLGQSREDVVRLLGDCAERMQYLPGGSGSLSVEILQPREGECRKRLGDRHFTLTGGVLKEMRPGALPPPPAPKPPPKGV